MIMVGMLEAIWPLYSTCYWLAWPFRRASEYKCVLYMPTVCVTFLNESQICASVSRATLYGLPKSTRAFWGKSANRLKRTSYLSGAMLMEGVFLRQTSKLISVGDSLTFHFL